MATRHFLGEFEQMLLLTVLRLDERAYGTPIREELAMCTGREFARGAIYVTLDRLEEKGLLRSRLAEPTAERGGRAKRYFTLTAAGLHAARDSRRVLTRLWSGLDAALEDL